LALDVLGDTESIKNKSVMIAATKHSKIPTNEYTVHKEGKQEVPGQEQTAAAARRPRRVRSQHHLWRRRLNWARVLREFWCMVLVVRICA